MEFKKRLFIILAAVTIVLLLMSCGNGINGTYVAADDENDVIKFSGNKVTWSETGASLEGDYKIEGDKIIISITLLGETIYDEELEFERNGNSIFIDGDEYVKK
jgi:hypothetical protein